MTQPLQHGGAYVIGEDGQPVQAEPPTGPARGRRWSSTRDDPPADPAPAEAPPAEAPPAGDTAAEAPAAGDTAAEAPAEPTRRRPKGAA